MSVLPGKDLEQIQFCESHLPIWSASPAAVGLTAGQCAALDTLTKAARLSYTNAQNARQASKAATTTFHTNVVSMRGTASDLIRTVKAFAENSANPGAVYAAAQIPEPLPPSPPPPPGTPEKVTVGLNPDGSIRLNWKARDAAPTSGAVFNIVRRVGASASYMSIGSGMSTGAGRFQFTDTTLAFGTQTASYIITGQRGTQMGTPSEAVNVQFGVASGGGGAGFSVTGATLGMAA